MENISYDKRDLKFIKILAKIYNPCFKYYFGLHLQGIENLKIEDNFILISNHNIGAIIESHGLLFFFQDHFPEKRIFGFTHPSLFKIPLIASYWKKIGAVPSTYEMADTILKHGDHLLIFPGGNRQATRTLWDYKNNAFPWTSGWAKIAHRSGKPVIPITIKNSHFVNPVLINSKLLSKKLILPYLLGVKWFPLSLSQVLMAVLTYILCDHLSLPLTATVLLTYLAFIFSVLIPILPSRIEVTFHEAIDSKVNDVDQIEAKVSSIMDSVYS